MTRLTSEIQAGYESKNKTSVTAPEREDPGFTDGGGTSLLLVIPMFLLFQLAPPEVDPQGNPVVLPSFVFLLFPLVYLILGYIGGAIASLCYNVIARFAGGFEFELNDVGQG